MGFVSLIYLFWCEPVCKDFPFAVKAPYFGFKLSWLFVIFLWGKILRGWSADYLHLCMILQPPAHSSFLRSAYFTWSILLPWCPEQLMVQYQLLSGLFLVCIGGILPFLLSYIKKHINKSKILLYVLCYSEVWIIVCIEVLPGWPAIGPDCIWWADLSDRSQCCVTSGLTFCLGGQMLITSSRGS